jgi:hypothetical protein
MLYAIGGDLFDGILATHNIFDCGENRRPVFENSEGHVLPLTVGDEI